MDNAYIDSSYSVGEIKVINQYAGGLVGYSHQTSNSTANIENSYSTMVITSSSDSVGGLVGHVNIYAGYLKISNVYYAGAITFSAGAVATTWGRITGSIDEISRFDGEGLYSSNHVVFNNSSVTPSDTIYP